MSYLVFVVCEIFPSVGTACYGGSLARPRPGSGWLGLTLQQALLVSVTKLPERRDIITFPSLQSHLGNIPGDVIAGSLTSRNMVVLSLAHPPSLLQEVWPGRREVAVPH